jgi:hypothetical protein
MLSQLDFKKFGLETIKEEYLHDAEFRDVLQNCRDGRIWNKFVLSDGFVFHANKSITKDEFVPCSTMVLFVFCCYRRRMEET